MRLEQFWFFDCFGFCHFLLLNLLLLYVVLSEPVLSVVFNHLFNGMCLELWPQSHVINRVLFLHFLLNIVLVLSIVPIKSRIGSFIVINGQISIPQSCHSSIILLHLRCLQVRFPELLFLLLVGHLAHLLLDLMLLVSLDHLKILLLLLFSALILHFLILSHVEEV